MRSALLLGAVLLIGGCGTSDPTGVPPVGPVTTEPRECGTGSCVPGSGDGTRVDLARVTVDRTGGFAGPRGGTHVAISDEAVLKKLRDALPDRLPDSFEAFPPCADCYEYRVLVQTKLVGETRSYVFSDAGLPKDLEPFVVALRPFLEPHPPTVDETGELRSGTARVVVRCPAEAPERCQGAATLHLAAADAPPEPFSAAPGESATLEFSLDGAACKLIDATGAGTGSVETRVGNTATEFPIEFRAADDAC
jgi:hypothetical protein